MMISCNGELQGLTAAGEDGTADSPLPELQIWRPSPDNSMNYSKIQFPVGCTTPSSNLLNCTLDTALSVVVGDIIGILLPRNNPTKAKFLIYFNTGMSTTNHILSLTSQSFTLPSTLPTDNAQPLIYLHIKPG